MLLFYETYLHSSLDKKRMLEARIVLKVEGLFFIFDLLHVQIFLQQNILVAMKF